MSNRVGKCPTCYQLNSYSTVDCIECKLRLPWADAAELENSARLAQVKLEEAAKAEQLAKTQQEEAEKAAKKQTQLNQRRIKYTRIKEKFSKLTKPIEKLYLKLKTLTFGERSLCIWLLISFLFFIFNFKHDSSSNNIEELKVMAIWWLLGTSFGIFIWFYIESEVQKNIKKEEKEQADKELAIEKEKRRAAWLAQPQKAVYEELNNLPNFTICQYWIGKGTIYELGLECFCIAIDEESLKIALLEYHRETDNVSIRILSPKDIIQVTVEEEGYMHSTTTTESTTTTQMHTSSGSMIGRAIIGGVLLGPAGAIIGGATAKKVGYGTVSGTQTTTNIDIVTGITLKLLVNDTRSPVFVINFLEGSTSKDTQIYEDAIKNASYWHGVIHVLKHRADPTNN